MLSLAESAVIANAVTTNIFRTNLGEFFTSTDGMKNSFQLTGREIVSGMMGGSAGIWKPTADKYGIDNTLSGVMMHNLKKNAVPLAIQMVAIPIAFRYGKKVLNPKIIRPLNKVISQQLKIKDVKI